MNSPSLYRSTVVVTRNRTADSDATGHIIEGPITILEEFPASVQPNRAMAGASGNHKTDRDTLDQPVTVRIYTPVNASAVKANDIAEHVQTGTRYQVLQSVPQGDRRGSWRIECSLL